MRRFFREIPAASNRLSRCFFWQLWQLCHISCHKFDIYRRSDDNFQDFPVNFQKTSVF